jgi:hypothetical protein
MNYLASVGQRIGTCLVPYLPDFNADYVEKTKIVLSHPLASLYLCSHEVFSNFEMLFHASSPSLVESYQAEIIKSAQFPLNEKERVQCAIEKIARDHFDSLNESQKNQVYGTLYHLKQPITSNPEWGREHWMDDIPCLINALNLNQLIENRLQPVVRVWKNEVSSTVRSCFYELDGRQSPERRAIGYINGIGTTLDTAKWDAYRLSDTICRGYNLEGVYNATHGAVQDCVVTLRVFNQESPKPVLKLLQRWRHFFHRHPDPQTRYLQICFSQGAAMVKRALDYLPTEYRSRIAVIAIAPAAFIPSLEKCHVAHFVKMSDIFPVSLAQGRERLSAEDPEIVIVPDEDGSVPHDPHGSKYIEKIAPYIENYLNSGSIYPS